MTKRILGEDPFDGPADGDDARPRDKRGKAMGAAARERRQATAADRAETPRRAAADAPTRRDGAAGRVAAPDAGEVCAVPDEALFTRRALLGAEAVVPERVRAAHPVHHARPHTVSDEVRELERRVARAPDPGVPARAPAPPAARLRCGSRYRKLAMRDRSDVVDEFGRDPVYAARFEPLLDFLYRRYFRVEVEGHRATCPTTAAPCWWPTTRAPCPTTASC